MGFLTGFGNSLHDSATLEQQAQIAKKAELTKANLDLAQLLLASDDPDNHAKAMAIYSDPSHAFRLDKDHPNLESVKRVMQSVPPAAVPAIASGTSPAGMAGMLGADNSPMAQPGITGDQGMPTVGAPPPGSVPSAALLAPPAAPPSAAMTTNPPATQGGTISPAAALGGAPPAPPVNLPPPSPGEKYQAALKAFQGQELPQGGISAVQYAEKNRAKLAMAQTMASANALFAAGKPEEAIAVLGGKTIIPYETKQMGIASTQHEGEANRTSKEKIAGEKIASTEEIAKGNQAIRQQALAQSLALAKQRIGIAKSRGDLVGARQAQRDYEHAIDKAATYTTAETDLLGGIQASRPLLQGAKDAIEKAGLQNDNSLAAGLNTRFQNAVYGAGFQEPFWTELNGQLSLAQATAARTLIRGRPSTQVYGDIKQHTPEVKHDTPAMLYEKINNILKWQENMQSGVEAETDSRVQEKLARRKRFGLDSGVGGPPPQVPTGQKKVGRFLVEEQ